MRRIAPALGLFVLSPLVAEFLLGNMSISAIGLLPVIAPLYGGGALLIRESARRAGRGWPTLILLGAAYAACVEGLVTQSLFNPSYFGFDLLVHTYVPAPGIGVWWTLFVLTLHTIWSTSASIALVEALVPRRTTTPWLGTPGLIVAAVLFLLGASANAFFTYQQEHFLASPAQLCGTVLVILILIAAAFSRRRIDRARTPDAANAPAPWLVGVTSLAASSLFTAGRYLPSWSTVTGWILLFAGVGWLIQRWSRRAGWGAAHRLALAGGALLTYAWHSFVETPIIGATGTVDAIGNAIFTTMTVVLLAAAARTVRRTGATGSGRDSGGLD